MGILTRSAKQAAMLSAVLSALVAGIVYLLGYPEFSRGLLIGMLAGVGFFYIMCDSSNKPWRLTMSRKQWRN